MPDSPVKEGRAGTTIDVWVVPGASRAAIDGLHGGKVKIRVTSPPEAGRANDEAARMLKASIGRPVILIRGMRTRAKVFQVTGGDVDTVRRKLGLR